MRNKLQFLCLSVILFAFIYTAQFIGYIEAIPVEEGTSIKNKYCFQKFTLTQCRANGRAVAHPLGYRGPST